MEKCGSEKVNRKGWLVIVTPPKLEGVRRESSYRKWQVFERQERVVCWTYGFQIRNAVTASK